jgi:hypothetical protein
MVDRIRTECESINPPWMVTMFQRILGISVRDKRTSRLYKKLKGSPGLMQGRFRTFFNYIIYIKKKEYENFEG